jgi:CubicO group peptidase (beta-lactamase class C family)
MKTNRRFRIWPWAVAVFLLAGLGAAAWFLIPGLHAPAPEYWPTNGWRTSTPEDQGFDSVKLAEGLQALRDSKVPIHSLLIIRNGYVVLDAYFYPYDGSFPHKLASVTKSVMTTLIGIAADQGRLKLDQPMVSFFPDRTIANLDDQKKSITVRHLTEMMNGMESGCLNGDEETLNKMRSSQDWVQAALDRRMVQAPGTSFCYDSPGMHLLSAILQKATGMTALEFARQNLFEPLGIHEVMWQTDPQGYTHGWGDLFLKPRDAAKIGYLWFTGGVWEGKRIVSAAWVADSVKVHSSGGSDDYGCGWWIARGTPPGDSYFAAGRLGQYIRVYPSYRAVVVATAQGMDYRQFEPMLTAAFTSPNKPLPANPAGVAQLNAALTTWVQSPRPWAVGPLADIAKAISGKTMVFGANAADVTTLRLVFSGASEATLYIQKRQGNDEVWSMSLDGTYRAWPDGGVLRGSWADPQTFVIEVFAEGIITYQFHFDNGRVEVSSPEQGLKFEGQVQNP